MIHQEITDEIREIAALYSLGVLPPTEAGPFAAHLPACPTCVAEVRRCEEVAGHLGAATPAAPPPSLRDRLLGQLGDTEVSHVGAGQGRWKQVGPPGLSIRPLSPPRPGRPRGRATFLVRLAPGARYPRHRHADMEELFVLSGELVGHDRSMGAGDFCSAPGGSLHPESWSPGGGTFLVTSGAHEALGEEAALGHREGLNFVFQAESPWRPGSASGQVLRPLFSDEGNGTRTALVRLSPGAQVSLPPDPLPQQLFVLDGQARLSARPLGCGDYLRTATPAPASTLASEAGCTLLFIDAAPSWTE